MAFVDSYMQRGLPTSVACVHVCPILCQKVDDLRFISKASMMHCSVSILVLQVGGRERGVEREGERREQRGKEREGSGREGWREEQRWRGKVERGKRGEGEEW